MSDGLSWVGVRGSDTGVVGLRTVCWLSDEVDCPFPPQVILSSQQVLHRKKQTRSCLHTDAVSSTSMERQLEPIDRRTDNYCFC